MTRLPALMSAVLAAAVVASLAAAPRAGEDADAPHLSDPAGDANAINGQGLGDLVGLEPEQPTAPAQYAPADLLGIRFETLTSDGATADGLVVNVLLSELPSAVGPELIYRVPTQVGACRSFFFVEVGAGAEPAVFWRQFDGCGLPPEADSGLGPDMTFTDEGWTVELDDEQGAMRLVIPFETLDERMADLLQVGTEFYDTTAHVRTVLVAITAPVVDELVDPEFLGWTLGQDIGLADAS